MAPVIDHNVCVTSFVTSSLPLTRAGPTTNCTCLRRWRRAAERAFDTGLYEQLQSNSSPSSLTTKTRICWKCKSTNTFLNHNGQIGFANDIGQFEKGPKGKLFCFDLEIKQRGDYQVLFM